MRSILLVLVGCAALILIPPQTGRAAPSLPPLYVTVHGSLWAWTPDRGARRVAPWPYTHPPVASADSAHIAYASVDEGEAQKLTALGSTSWQELYGLGSNIVLLNTQDNSTVTLTAGPIGATTGTQTPVRALALSEPSWSPDGMALAWVEDPSGSRNDNSVPILVIYRPATASFARYPETMEGGTCRRSGAKRVSP
jgi:hypothetical protein